MSDWASLLFALPVAILGGVLGSVLAKWIYEWEEKRNDRNR